MSICKSFANATLFYSTYDVKAVTDKFCEPERVEQTREIKLSLEDVTHYGEIRNVGVRRDNINLEGRCVSPRRLPKDLEHGKTYELEFEPVLGQKLRAKAYLVPVVSSRLGLGKRFGDFVALEVEVRGS